MGTSYIEIGKAKRREILDEIESIKISDPSSNEVVDNYLIEYCLEVKKVVKQYEKNGYTSMSSFLMRALIEFKKFLKEWEEEESKNI